MQEPQESDALIAIVDDDPSVRPVRRGLQRLIRSLGWKAERFARQLLGLHPGYNAKAIVALVLKAPERGRPG
jgi:FixJ family two-component response regulator